MELKLADLFDSQQLGGLIEILGELRDGMDVAARRVGTKVPAPEFLQHPLTKWGHTTLLYVTETTARYRPQHPRNCVRRASGLVLTGHSEVGWPGQVDAKTPKPLNCLASVNFDAIRIEERASHPLKREPGTG